MPGLLRARGRVRTSRRCGPRHAATATAGWSAARRSGRRTPRWRSGASCWPAPPSGEGAAKKQQGLTIFLVPMDDPAIQVRPIRCMLGPHHLNEVFFDDLRVTEADVLGTVDDGWSIVQDVLSFERVGIARYARCERLLLPRPTVLGDRWDELPAELRGRWVADADALPPGPAAGLPAWSSLQSTGRIEPGDAAAYRIAVTKLDQDSAEVLMDIVAEVVARRPDGRVVPAVRSRTTGGTRRPPPCRRAASRCSASCCPGPCWRRRMILDLSDEAKEYGRQAFGRSRRPAATSWCSRPKPSPSPGGAGRPGAGRAGRVGPRPAHRCRRAGGRGRTVPQRRLLGAAVPGRRTAGPADRPRRRRAGRGRRRRPVGAVGGLRVRWAAVTLDGARSECRPDGAGRPGVRRRARTVAPLDADGAARRRARHWCCRAGRCSACSTARWS